MKGIALLFCLLFSRIVFSQDRSAEFYWLGYSTENEKEMGYSGNPASMRLNIFVEDKDILKMHRLIDVAGVKFKRMKYVHNCSNCHNWFSSKKGNPLWIVGNYFNYEPTQYDSISKIQWYKPTFRSEFLLNASIAEKTAYLKGLYLKSGKLDTLKVILIIDESPGKSEATKNLLLDLGFKNVESTVQTIVRDFGIILGNRTILSFTITEEFLSAFKTEIDIHKTIDNKN